MVNPTNIFLLCRFIAECLSQSDSCIADGAGGTHQSSFSMSMMCLKVCCHGPFSAGPSPCAACGPTTKLLLLLLLSP